MAAYPVEVERDLRLWQILSETTGVLLRFLSKKGGNTIGRTV